MSKDVATIMEVFFENYRPRTYSKGQILIYNGETSEFVYYLVKGKVKKYDVTYRGEEIILNIFKPRAFFPMSLAINKSENAYTYEAETAVEVRPAPADEVAAFLKAHPDVMFDLLSRVYTGLDGILGRMARLMSSSARGRLLYELIIEVKRFGVKQPDCSWHIHVSEKDLGARAGLTRETVSREIRKLKDEQIVSVRGKEITILDYEKLETQLSHAL